MPTASARIVVQATAEEKRAIVAKAKKLRIGISELMRRGAHQYASAPSDDELGMLADAARRAAERSGAAIDAALSYIDESNRRIAAMETVLGGAALGGDIADHGQGDLAVGANRRLGRERGILPHFDGHHVFLANAVFDLRRRRWRRSRMRAAGYEAECRER